MKVAHMLWHGLLAFGLVVSLGACSSDGDDNPTTPGGGDTTGGDTTGGDTTGGDTTGDDANTITMLMVAPLTGDASGSGEGIRNAARLALSEINYTVGDYTIEIVEIDSISDTAGADSETPDIGAAYRAAMTENNAVAGFLNWHSGIALELMEVAAEAQMAHLFGMGASGAINEKYKSDEKYEVWGAKGWPTPGTYVKSYFDAMACALESTCTDLDTSGAIWEPAHKNIMIVGESGAWGDSFAAGARGVAEDADGYWAQNGWVVALDMKVDADMDASTLAAKADEAAAANVTMVVMTSTADNAYEFIDQLRAKLDNPVIVTEGLGWANTPGITAEGVMDGGWGPYNSDPAAADRIAAFQTNYELEYGSAPSVSTSGFGYDYTNFAISILERALEKSGEITRESVLDIYKTEVQTGTLSYTGGVVMSEYKYTTETAPDPVYELGKYYFPVFQYQDTDSDGALEYKIVYPANLAESSFELPGSN